MKRTLKNRLRIRFVLISMLSLFLFQTVIVGVSMFHNHRDLVNKSDMLISQLHSHPSGGNRYFSVRIPAEKDTMYPDVIQNVSVTAQEATEYARRALAQQREKGFLDGYRYHIYRNESGWKLYFLSRESSIEMCRNAAKNMIGVSMAGLAVIGILLIPVSGWVVNPLVQNHRKQKEFITSAGHALKTPLTVIHTHAQLLQSEIGDNLWLEGIQKQTEHLTRMTHGLVALSKAEEWDHPLCRQRFSFSETLREAAEPYEILADQKGIRMETNVPEDLEYTGNREEIRQLLLLLLDNACEYCPEGGTIRLQAKHTFHGVGFSVSNPAPDLAGQDGSAFVGRFFRGQNATGKKGFGLGLSVADAIVRRHNGHFSVFVTPEGDFRVEILLR